MFRVSKFLTIFRICHWIKFITNHIHLTLWWHVIRKVIMEALELINFLLHQHYPTGRQSSEPKVNEMVIVGQRCNIWWSSAEFAGKDEGGHKEWSNQWPQLSWWERYLNHWDILILWTIILNLAGHDECLLGKILVTTICAVVERLKDQCMLVWSSCSCWNAIQHSGLLILYI